MRIPRNKATNIPKNIPASQKSLKVAAYFPHRGKTYSIPFEKGKVKILGSVGREWQTGGFDTIKDAVYALIIAFCGSGKTILQVALAIYDIIKSDYKQKQLIIVPQQHIGMGFAIDRDYGVINIMVAGKEYEWQLSRNNFCDDKSDDIINRLKKWLLADPELLAKDFRSNVISGLNAVASHQALARVWRGLSQEERKKAIKNLTLRVDEAHHIKGVFSNTENGLTPEQKIAIEEESTHLGDICRFIYNNNDGTSKMHFTTATPYRGDRCIILSDDVKKDFKIYSLDLLEFFKTLGVEHIIMQYEEYISNPIKQIIKNVKKDLNKKHLIIIPSTGDKWRFEFDSYLPLKSELCKIYGHNRVLDLVETSTQDKNKALLLQEPKTGEDGKSKFDAIITCSLGREGTDWCPCSRLHNSSCGNSITMAVQTFGRPCRRYKDKADIEMYNYVEKFIVPKIGITKRDLLSDRTNALLVCATINEILYPILILPKSKTSTGERNPCYLDEILGNDNLHIKEELIEAFECMENKNSKNIDKAIYKLLDKYEINKNREEIKEGLRIFILRPHLLPKLIAHFDVALVRKHGFDKIVEKHIKNQSIFFGGYGEKELKQLREILEDKEEEWMRMYNASLERRKKKYLSKATN